MTSHYTISETLIAKAKVTVERALRTMELDLEEETTLTRETPNSVVQRVVKVFNGVKPLLKTVSSLPLLPVSWRTGVKLLLGALDTLSGVDLFKAGKDL